MRVAFFEEPVPFDRLEDTNAVADALRVPIAGGEQDASAYYLRWSLAHDALQVVQPDLFYFGGLIRCIRAARMAAALGRDRTPHIRGRGWVPVHAAFCRLRPQHRSPPGVHGSGRGRARPHTDASLRAEGGLVTVPTGPGLGVEIDPAWIAHARVL